MSAARLRRQAEVCAEIAAMMSDARDRDRLRRTEQMFRRMADEEEARDQEGSPDPWRTNGGSLA